MHTIPPPLPTLSAAAPLLPTCQGSCWAAFCFLLAFQSLESCPPVSQCMQCTEVSGGLVQPEQCPGLLHQPCTPCMLSSISHPMAFLSNISQHLWGQEISRLELRFKWLEVAAVVMTSVWCHFALGQLDTHLCACLVLMDWGQRKWQEAEGLVRRDSRSCTLFSVLPGG